jgi:hypothetical protein
MKLLYDNARNNQFTAIAGRSLVEIARALTAAMTSLEAATERSRELTPLIKQHGDLFRELLDTIQ